MNTYITLDYELFFGKSGTVDNTMIFPTQELLKVLDKHYAKAVFFVDIGYLLRVKKLSDVPQKLKNDAQKVILQIKDMASQGHDIQLHIHPHWEDAYYENNQWYFPMQNYRLHNIPDEKRLKLFKEYKEYLEEISGQKITAYRAGGWCIQPFDKIKQAFLDSEISIDSTVFKNGKNIHGLHYYDFKNAPDSTEWRFTDDPCTPVNNGLFTEIPIASYKVSPLFFWKFLFLKKTGGKIHHAFGDGHAVKNGLFQKMRLMFLPSNTVVSIDGYKASYLQKAFSKYLKKHTNGNFVIIGHPKALSPYSLKKLDEFLQKNKTVRVKTFADYLNNT